MGIFKTSGRLALRYLTPIPTLKRQGQEIMGGVTRTVERAKIAHKAIKMRAQQPAQQPRPGETPKQRFERLAAEQGLTDYAWRVQAGRHRIAKFVWLAAGLFSAGGALTIAATLPNLFMAAISMLLTLGGVVFFGKAVMTAWYEHQLINRSLHGIKEFIGSPEFFRYMFT